MVREQLIPPNEHPIISWFKNWPTATPFVSKWLFLLSTTILFLSTIFSFSTTETLGNDTWHTIFRYQFYRLWTSWLIYTNWLDWVFMFLILSFLGARMEKGMGSFRFFIMTMVIGLITNILFNGAMVLLAYNPFGKELGYLHLSCAGFWGLCYGFMMVQCLQSPETLVPVLCCPFLVPNKYLPWIIVLMVSFFLGFQFSALAGVTAGALYGRGLFDRLLPSTTTIQRWENRQLGWLTRQKGYVENWCCIGFQELSFFDSTTSQQYLPVQQPSYNTFPMAPAPPPPRSFALSENDSSGIPVAVPVDASHFPGEGLSSGTATGVQHAQRMDRQTIRETLAAAAEARIPPPAAGIPGQQLKQ